MAVSSSLVGAELDRDSCAHGLLSDDSLPDHQLAKYRDYAQNPSMSTMPVSINDQLSSPTSLLSS
jgi:hypothetical protein